jgi:hypothetical protein
MLLPTPPTPSQLSQLATSDLEKKELSLHKQHFELAVTQAEVGSEEGGMFWTFLCTSANTSTRLRATGVGLASAPYHKFVAVLTMWHRYTHWCRNRTQSVEPISIAPAERYKLPTASSRLIM